MKLSIAFLLLVKHTRVVSEETAYVISIFLLITSTNLICLGGFSLLLSQKRQGMEKLL